MLAASEPGLADQLLLLVPAHPPQRPSELPDGTSCNSKPPMPFTVRGSVRSSTN